MSSEEQQPGIRTTDFSDEVRSNFLTYAEYVIKDRAIPDARDGLKPVHRRILWTMWDGGYRSSSQHRKSARIVGDIMGRYHPHGDSAIYDAMARMAQPFSLGIPLVDGKGNFGNVDGDNPAAMRYTEARLSRFAEAVLFADVEEDTVDFVPNYDGSEDEPVTLPARVPLLLLTAPTGIAVGMATSVLPFNLGEVCDAVVSLINNHRLSLRDLHSVLPAPDFPLGGIVAGVKPDIYREGKGSVKFRAPVKFEDGSKRSLVIFTGVPFGMDKAKLVERLAEAAREGKVEGVSDVRDESSKHGIRVCVEIEHRSCQDAVMNSIYQATDFQTTHSMNMVTIMGKRPRLVGIRGVLVHFVRFRRDVIKRRTARRRLAAEERQEIVDAVLVAVADRDGVMRAIESSDEPVAKLRSDYDFSERQAEYVYNMPLRRFGKIDRAKVESERADLIAAIEDADDILARPERVDDVIVDEVGKIRDEFAVDRRTMVIRNFADISMRDTVKAEDVVFTFLSDGAVKSTLISDYRLQRRRGRGSSTGVKVDEGVYPIFTATVNTHDDVMLFTDKGHRHKIDAFDIPPAKKGRKGVLLTDVVPGIGDGERVVSVVKSNLSDDEVLIVLGSAGYLKKQTSETVIRARDSTTDFYDVERGGSVIGAIVAGAEDEVVMVSAQGQVLRTELGGIREVKSRTSAGVSVFKMRNDDRILSLSRAEPEGCVLTVTKSGYAKRTSIEEFSPKGRTSMGVRGCTLPEGDEVVFGRAVCIEDEDTGLFVMTNYNRVIRMRFAEVKETGGRNSLGTQLKRMDDGECVTTVTVE